jgi:hypothetical protein
MNWIRARYDRLALIVGALFLLVSAFFIWRHTVQVAQSFVALQLSPPARKAGPLPAAAVLQEAARALRQPAQWTMAGRSGLFVPEKHFIGPDGLPATLQNTEIHPPVPNEWLEQFGLPIADADVLKQDPDDDGFTNLDEWLARTNPMDQSVHPEYVTKLKMKSFVSQPFRMVFASWVGDTYAINAIDLKGPTQFLKVGDIIRGTEFKIVKFSEKSALNRFGTIVDVSELLLEHKTTKDQLTLIKEKTAISPESVANLIYGWGPVREFSVRKDQEFSLPPHEEIKYKLIDVQPDKALIIDTRKPEERINIGLLTE